MSQGWFIEARKKLGIACLAFLAFTGTTRAQDKDGDLRALIEQQRKLMEEQRKQMEEQGKELKDLRKQIETHFGFQIVLARTEVGGYCSHCQSLRAQELERAAAAHAPATTHRT